MTKPTKGNQLTYLLSILPICLSVSALAQDRLDRESAKQLVQKIRLSGQKGYKYSRSNPIQTLLDEETKLFRVRHVNGTAAFRQDGSLFILSLRYDDETSKKERSVPELELEAREYLKSAGFQSEHHLLHTQRRGYSGRPDNVHFWLVPTEKGVPIVSGVDVAVESTTGRLISLQVQAPILPPKNTIARVGKSEAELISHQALYKAFDLPPMQLLRETTLVIRRRAFPGSKQWPLPKGGAPQAEGSLMYWTEYGMPAGQHGVYEVFVDALTGEVLAIVSPRPTAPSTAVKPERNQTDRSESVKAAFRSAGFESPKSVPKNFKAVERFLCSKKLLIRADFDAASGILRIPHGSNKLYFKPTAGIVELLRKKPVVQL